MSRLIDKSIILTVSVFAMYQSFHSDVFMILLYLSLAISSLNYYLLEREQSDMKIKLSGIKENIAFLIQIIYVIAIFFFHPMIFLIPILMYDIAHSRNFIACTLSVIASVNVMPELKIQESVFLILLSILSVIMSLKSEQELVLRAKYKHLRDDSVEKNLKLRSQNQELLDARDNEVYNAQLSERNRIAREIHDNVGHTLSRAILQVGALMAIHKEDPVHSELEEVRQTLDSAMNNIRSSVHDLHDDSIDVAASIRQMAEPLYSKYSVTLDIDIGDDMPRPIKYACIGITKECISNIIKHSRNSNVDIRLSEHPSMYQLVIHDYNPNGSDSYPEKISVARSDVGMGLENIKTRTESVNGSLNISTENGYRIFVTIPRNQN